MGCAEGMRGQQWRAGWDEQAPIGPEPCGPLLRLRHSTGSQSGLGGSPAQSAAGFQSFWLLCGEQAVQGLLMKSIYPKRGMKCYLIEVCVQG